VIPEAVFALGVAGGPAALGGFLQLSRSPCCIRGGPPVALSGLWVTLGWQVCSTGRWAVHSGYQVTGMKRLSPSLSVVHLPSWFTHPLFTGAGPGVRLRHPQFTCFCFIFKTCVLTTCHVANSVLLFHLFNPCSDLRKWGFPFYR